MYNIAATYDTKAAIIHCDAKKTRHISLVRNFAKCLPIFKILSLLDSAVNLQSYLKITPSFDPVATLPCEDICVQKIATLNE